MQTITSIRGHVLPQEDPGGVLADHMTLEQWRVFRRLLVARCGALALLAAFIGSVVHGFSLAARVGSVLLLLVAPVCVWIAELRQEYRLSRRLERIDGVETRTLHVESIETVDAL